MSIKKIHNDELFYQRFDLLVKTSKYKGFEIAESVNLSPAAITNMRKGRSNPSPNTLTKLSEYFKVSEEWLAYGTGEKERKFEVTQVIEPETKKTADHPLKQAIYGYVDKMTDDELLAEVTALAKKFSGEQKQ